MMRKWNIANDNSKADYDAGNEITYNTVISLIFVITTILTF